MKPSRLAAAAAMMLLSWPVLAQYKWVAADGTVTYGDRPPDTNVQRVHTGGAGRAPANVGNENLPYELRGPVAKYPVTLYTTPDCGPCNDARTLLSTRGVPYNERVLRTAADLESFKAQGFADKLMPAVSVGRQRQTGFEAGSLNSLLDAAGYPKQSKLARGWRPAPAEPMTPEANASGEDAGTTAAGAPPPAGQVSAQAAPRAPLPAPTPQTAGNAPPGFRF